MPRPPSRRDLLPALAALPALPALLLLPSPARAQAPAPVPAPAPAPAPVPQLTFVVNVQDFRYLDDSADTVVALAALFRKHGVRGDFYLNGPMCERYLARRPDAIAALRDQGLCYHVRPPHPLFEGFDGRLEGASPQDLAALLLQAETQALDLATGALDPKAPGGFSLVRDTFGRAPSTVAMPNRNPAVRAAACATYRELGARAVVWFHGARTKADQPFEWQQGLLARPCDVAVDRWAAPGEQKEELWWNRYRDGQAPRGAGLAEHLAQQAAAWSGARAPYMLVLTHDNNYSRRGPDPWVHTYWTDNKKSAPRSPPYDLAAPDPGQARSKAEQRRILAALEEAVAWAAAHARVVTMEEIVTEAEGQR